MAIFTVHVPPGIADPLRRAEHTIFLKEGFSLAAFLFGPLYLLIRRLWVAAFGWVVAAGLIGLLCFELDLPRIIAVLLVFLLALLTGLEARETWRQALDKRGFVLASLLSGMSREEGERAFFGAGPPRMPAARPPAEPRPADDDVIGLFPTVGDLP